MHDHPALGRLETFPWSDEVLADCTPVYKSVPGWEGDIPNSGKISDLLKAQDYIKAVEEAIGGPVSMVGTGVNRTDALFK